MSLKKIAKTIRFIPYPAIDGKIDKAKAEASWAEWKRIMFENHQLSTACVFDPSKVKNRATIIKAFVAKYERFHPLYIAGTRTGFETIGDCDHYFVLYPELDQEFTDLETLFVPHNHKLPSKSRQTLGRFRDHFAARVIERAQTATFSEFKEAMCHCFIIPLVKITRNNTISIEQDLIMVFDDYYVSLLAENKWCTWRTIVTKEMWEPRQKEIVSYLLNQTEEDYCLLSCKEIPRSFTEANNVLIDTPKLLDPQIDEDQMDKEISRLYSDNPPPTIK